MRKLHSVAAVLVAAAPMIASTCASAQESMEPPSIVVTGTGRASGTPDTAEVVVGVTSDGATAADALDANNAAMQQLLDVLRQRGIADQDIRTSNFTLQPRYDYNNEKNTQNLIGYQVSNLVNVKVRTLPILGALLDEVVRAGGNTINGVNYSVDDPTGLFDSARVDAMADAQRKAAIYAQAAGRMLGCVMSVAEHTAGGPQPFAKAAAMRAESAVPLAQGQIDFQVDVTVTYRMGSAAQGCDPS